MHLECRTWPFKRAFTWTIFLMAVVLAINFQPDFWKYVYYVECNHFDHHIKSRIISCIGKFKKTELSRKNLTLRVGLSQVGWIFFVTMHLRSNSEFWIRAISDYLNGNHLRWVWPSHLFWCLMINFLLLNSPESRERPGDDEIEAKSIKWSVVGFSTFWSYPRRFLEAMELRLQFLIFDQIW